MLKKHFHSNAIDSNTDLFKSLMLFLKENPDPSDISVHDWADIKGYQHHEVEEVLYRMATKFVKFMTGGKSNNFELGLSVDDVDFKELQKGIEVESEHIEDVMVQEKIALDHLAEDKNYYTKLLKMENDSALSDLMSSAKSLIANKRRRYS